MIPRLFSQFNELNFGYQWSSMDPGRLKRKEEINKALTFIQSSLAYPDPESYQDFLTGLIYNLLEEGNALLKDGAWEEAVKEFSEGLNVSQYAAAEAIHIPEALLESLYVNRAAAYHSMEEYDCSVEDCDKALSVCKDNRQALYRKALCLKELGKYKDAYSCTTDCLLINRMDNQVNELAQELAIHLGLKIRTPYVSAKEKVLTKRDVTNGKPTQEPSNVCSYHAGNCTGALARMTPGNFSSRDQTAQGCTQLALSSESEMPDDSELMLDDLDSLLDSFSNEPGQTETHLQTFSAPGLAFTSKQTAPSILPAPTPQLPPAFFSSAGSQLNSLDSFIGSGCMTSTLDALDDVSTSTDLCALDNSIIICGTAVPNVRPSPMIQNSQGDLDSLDNLLTSNTNAVQVAPKAETDTKKLVEEALEISPELISELSCKSGLNAVDCLDFLDALDPFPSMENIGAIVGTGVDSLSDFKLNGVSDVLSTVPLKTDSTEQNKHSPAKLSKALTSSHEFMPACSTCFPRRGKGIYTFVHKPDLEHNCEKDILLCKEKDSPLPWTRVRHMPRGSFIGPFVLCRELLKSGDLGVCKYGENCTFAFNQLEIDVWTEERRGRFDRKLLFEKPSLKQDPVNCIIQLLQEYNGMFIFLCGVCYDGKPTIISRRSRDDNTICSNVDAQHSFDANKCLAFMIRHSIVRFKKVRPLHLLCHLDICRHSIRYGCQMGDKCMFAHSEVELKTWMLQRQTGTTPEEIVKVSTNYYEKQEKLSSNKQQSNKQPPGGTGISKGGRPNERLKMRMRFVCGHCWRDGVITDPDKTLKHCSAKAKHMWSKDRRVLLVKSLERSTGKWIMVRSLPHCRNFPSRYDVCHRILDKGRCNVGNCTFAHSQEEKDMWTYMKNNKLVDMQQVYDMWWVALSTQNQQTNEPMVSQSMPGEKCIVMPTDYAEPMDGFHCRLCGKHSNSERQWQQHISTEKHKDRVFSCDEEDKALTWNHRFPAKCFDLCPKLDEDCPDGMSCDYAHSPEELQEWLERRDFLRHKLARAREDMLIMPDECDFGKYNFLLQD